MVIGWTRLHDVNSSTGRDFIPSEGLHGITPIAYVPGDQRRAESNMFLGESFRETLRAAAPTCRTGVGSVSKDNPVGVLEVHHSDPHPEDTRPAGDVDARTDDEHISL